MIHFFFTGGTIDSVWDATVDTAVPRAHSVIPQFLKNLKLYEKTTCTEICMKDSRALSNVDRKKLLNEISKTKAKRIVVTHGTYTMPDTARYLAANLKRHDQIIILTGSMIPLEGFSPSDAPFNLGFAVAKLDDLQPGVYVAMNGRVFAPEEVLKTLNEGRFTSVFSRNA